MPCLLIQGRFREGKISLRVGFVIPNRCTDALKRGRRLVGLHCFGSASPPAGAARRMGLMAGHGEDAQCSRCLEPGHGLRKRTGIQTAKSRLSLLRARLDR